MILIPIQTENHVKDTVIIILDPESIERMAAGDPAEADLHRCGKQLVNPRLMVCQEKPTKEFTDLLNGGDIEAIIKYLTRGWKYQPDRGDHDRGPESLKESN